MVEKFDCIVVGAGMSGNAAAYVLAKRGLSVLQLERGEYSGSKNVQGAILYADMLEKLIPDFRDDAPLERHLVDSRFWMLDDPRIPACTIAPTISTKRGPIATRSSARSSTAGSPPVFATPGRRFCARPR